jgi:hypothetical protein
VLTQRLNWLVDHGILARRRYSERPPRFDYLLADKGLEFCDILLTVAAWGDRWAAGPEGPPARYRHGSWGQITHVELHCASCGEPLHAGDVTVEPGPAPRRATPTDERAEGRGRGRVMGI